MRLIMFTGIMLFVIAIAIGALVENESRTEYEMEYENYQEIQLLRAVVVTSPTNCFFNDSIGNETCYESTNHIEYINNGTLRIPIKNSQVNKLKDIDGNFVYIDRDTYSSDGVLSIWDVPIGDRNLNEYPRCIKYEIDKGVCKEVAVR